MDFNLRTPLPSLNEFLKETKQHWAIANRTKQEREESLMWEMDSLPPITRPGVYVFRWVLKNKRQDPDNICFAKKFIFDALQKAGKLERDSLQWVVGFEDHFEVGEPHVQVEITFVD